MPVIVQVRVYDIRFPTSEGMHGSDAMHPDPDYSATYVVLHTDDGQHEGHGLTFTIGRGNEIVTAAVEALKVGEMHIHTAHMHMHTHTCTHAHMHTCTHAHTHMHRHERASAAAQRTAHHDLTGVRVGGAHCSAPAVTLSCSGTALASQPPHAPHHLLSSCWAVVLSHPSYTQRRSRPVLTLLPLSRLHLCLCVCSSPPCRSTLLPLFLFFLSPLLPSPLLPSPPLSLLPPRPPPLLPPPLPPFSLLSPSAPPSSSSLHVIVPRGGSFSGVDHHQHGRVVVDAGERRSAALAGS